MNRLTPKDQIVGEVAKRVAPAFGLTPTAIAFALSTAITIGATIHQRVTRFDAGYDSAIVDLRDGGIELEDEVLEIKTKADQYAIDSWQDVLDAQGEYEETDNQAVKSLEGQVAYYKGRLRLVNEERKNDPKTPWDDVPLPTHERVRFDKLNRERDSDGSADASAAIDHSPELAGYPTSPNAKRP